MVLVVEHVVVVEVHNTEVHHMVAVTVVVMEVVMGNGVLIHMQVVMADMAAVMIIPVVMVVVMVQLPVVEDEEGDRSSRHIRGMIYFLLFNMNL